MTARERALRWLRVPHEPVPPAGDEHVRVFNAAPNYMRYLYVRWVIQHVAAAVGLWLALQWSGSIVGVIPDRIEIGPVAVLSGTWIRRLIYAAEAFAVLGFLAQLVGSFLLIRLDFEQRWYIVSDRSLRIREGLVRLHEKTMTFANVQNVSVQQGPLERLLGIANVEVRTAGGGSSEKEPGKASDDLHVAYFRGVADADAIRDAIRERLRHYRDSGLGDPEDSVPAQLHAAAPPSSLLQPARELAAEARALRQALRA